MKRDLIQNGKKEQKGFAIVVFNLMQEPFLFKTSNTIDLTYVVNRALKTETALDYCYPNTF